MILLLSTVALHASKIPELEISEAEAEKIGAAASNVARHYDVAKQSQKAIDWVALISTVGIVTGQRVIAYNFRTAKAKSATIHEMPNPLRR